MSPDIKVSFREHLQMTMIAEDICRPLTEETKVYAYSALMELLQITRYCEKNPEVADAYGNRRRELSEIVDAHAIASGLEYTFLASLALNQLIEVPVEDVHRGGYSTHYDEFTQVTRV